MRIRRWLLVVPWLAGVTHAAGESTEKLKGFGLAESAETPAFGRVVVVFLLLAALAWGAAWLLRRYGGRLRIAGVDAAGPIRPLARRTLPGGVACHLVDVEGSRVLITATRHGVTSLKLGDAPPPASQVAP